VLQVFLFNFLPFWIVAAADLKCFFFTVHSCLYLEKWHFVWSRRLKEIFVERKSKYVIIIGVCVTPLVVLSLYEVQSIKLLLQTRGPDGTKHSNIIKYIQNHKSKTKNYTCFINRADSVKCWVLYLIKHDESSTSRWMWTLDFFKPLWLWWLMTLLWLLWLLWL